MSAAVLSPWKRLNLNRKFTVVAAAFTVVLMGLIGFNIIAIEAQKANTVTVDLAGRQRMLSQKYVKEVILAGMGLEADSAATLKVMRETLSALLEGGMAVINLDSGERVAVPMASNAEVRVKLAEQGTLIREMEAEGGRYLALPAADPRRVAKLKELTAAQALVVNAADQGIRLVNRDAQDRIGFAVMLQVIVGIGSALIGMGISWVIGRQIADPLAACAVAAGEIAKGNLRIEPLRISSGDEIGTLQASFNQMLASLREIALHTREVCENLTMASIQIMASTKEQAAGTKQQAAAVQEITTTVEEISQSGKQVADRARQVAGTAEAVANSGAAGLQAVRDASQGMEAIREQAETVAENIVTLSERTQAVGEIIATVNDIAEQSNLVALNAAIEAADAREQGRRFSVVANEIKNLADQAKEATAQVRSILEQTQKGINTSVMLTEEALKRVESGREKTSVSEQVIRQMAGNIQESVHAFQQIVGATNQQQIGLEQVTQALHEIRQASQQTASTTAQLEKASVELTQLGQQLAKTLEKYRL
ncbi:MAG: methyl-accepting chemotaxis protein [Magnetospirillum sp.]|nr:methyl-accepting chemotaxis protein [Magnetospirillum sp.]